MAVRRPLIIDGGSIKELPSGDTLPAVGKTAATLTHTAGAVTLDVQAADLYRFEADVFAPGAAASVQAKAQNSFASSVLPTFTQADLISPQIGDVLICALATHETGAGTLSSDWTLIGSAFSFVNRVSIYYKEWNPADGDYIFAANAAGMYTAATITQIRASGLDTPITFAAGSGVNQAPAITTVDTSPVSVLRGFAWSDNQGSDHPGHTVPVGYTQEQIEQYVTASNGSRSVAIFSKDTPVAPPETLPSLSFNFTDAGRVVATFSAAFRGFVSSGEKDYTFSFSNIPAAGVATGLIEIELKTDTGSVAFAGGTVTWIGPAPAFDAVGRYLIGFAADSTGITLWREA